MSEFDALNESIGPVAERMRDLLARKAGECVVLIRAARAAAR